MPDGRVWVPDQALGTAGPSRTGNGGREGRGREAPPGTCSCPRAGPGALCLPVRAVLRRQHFTEGIRASGRTSTSRCTQKPSLCHRLVQFTSW